MGFYTETMCTFETTAMLCICRTIEKSKYRIHINLGKLESIMVVETHHWKRQLLI